MRFLSSGIGWAALIYLWGLMQLAPSGGPINKRIKGMIMWLSDEPRYSIAGQKYGRAMIYVAHVVLALVIVLFAMPLTDEDRYSVGKYIPGGTFIIIVALGFYYELITKKRAGAIEKNAQKMVAEIEMDSRLKEQEKSLKIQEIETRRDEELRQLGE